MNITKFSMILALIIIDAQSNASDERTTSTPQEVIAVVVQNLNTTLPAKMQLNANDYPELQQGFEFIGRDLQYFFDTTIEQFDTTPEPLKKNPEYYEMQKTLLNNVLQAAKTKIVTTLSNDDLSKNKFNQSIRSVIHNPQFNCFNDPYFQYYTTLNFMKPVVKQCLDTWSLKICCSANGYIVETSDLFYAVALSNNDKAAELLISLGVDQNKLMLRAMQNNADKVLQKLIDIGYDINSSLYLHHAVKKENKKFVTLLLAAGANLYEEDNDGKTPWDIAKSDSMRNILKPKKSQVIPHALQITNDNSKSIQNIVVPSAIVYKDEINAQVNLEELPVVNSRGYCCIIS